jgi:phosphate transport system substrate-binding protein
VKWPAGIGLAPKAAKALPDRSSNWPGAIGYAELAYADQNKISYADMKNSSGNFISRRRPIPSARRWPRPEYPR